MRSLADRVTVIDEANIRLEYTQHEAGFEALVGSQLGRIVVRMLVDYKHGVGGSNIQSSSTQTVRSNWTLSITASSSHPLLSVRGYSNAQWMELFYDSMMVDWH